MKIPFNLHDAIDGKPVINGDGRDFELESYNPGDDYPLVGKINGQRQVYLKNGQCIESRVSESLDLFMKPEKITRWILVNGNSGFDTKEGVIDYMRCAKLFTQDSSAIIKLEFYPGENLND